MRSGEGGRHIAVVAPPVRGHYQPLLVLADALARLGHRVTFVQIEDARTMTAGRAAGFHAIGQARYGPGALDRYLDVLARADGPLGLVRMIRASAAMTRMLLDDLPDALALIGADAVLAEAAEPAGGLAARYLGLPFVTAHTGLPLIREPGVPPPFVGWRYRADERGVRRNVAGYRVTDWLMRPVDGVTAEYARRWSLNGRAYGGFSPLLQVAQCPGGLDFPRADLPSAFHYCGPFRVAEDAAPDLPGDRPLVFCSLGSLQGDRRRVFAAMSRACAELGARAVIGHGGRLSDADAARLPGDPLVRAFWPQRAVLARCAAAIIHGGFNTALDALGEGVPMAVMPIAFEQPATAARLAHAGAAKVLRGSVGARRLRTALRRVLSDPSYRAAAQRIGGEMRDLAGAERAAALIDAALSARARPSAAS